jgi:hypothetical protein
MKKSSAIISALLGLITISLCFTGCRKKDSPVKFPMGAFPDSVFNLTSLNSQYDDYNSNILSVGSNMSIIFSSNRQSTGGQFDLVQGSISYKFDQNTGAFTIGSALTNDPFYSSLISKAITSGNDFGPLSLSSLTDGYNYLFLASQTVTSPLDIYYLKYFPPLGTTIPAITGPFPAKLLNSSADDAYVSFDLNEDSVYFTSNRGGNYDIYVQKKTSSITLDTWMGQNFATSTPADSINSSSEDKCPFVLKKYMLFTSNRPGGLGGYDLYYSIFRNGKWNSPVNLGPGVNSSSDEFRPVLGYNADFSNTFIIYSSNRPGGLGGYDLYLTSFNNPK